MIFNDIVLNSVLSVIAFVTLHHVYKLSARERARKTLEKRMSGSCVTWRPAPCWIVTYVTQRKTCQCLPCYKAFSR